MSDCSSRAWKVPKTVDMIESPPHYTKGNIECIKAIRASLSKDGFVDYCRGNVLKYVWRCRDKGNLLDDLRKARAYLDFAIEEVDKSSKHDGHICSECAWLSKGFCGLMRVYKVDTSTCENWTANGD